MARAGRRSLRDDLVRSRPGRRSRMARPGHAASRGSVRWTRRGNLRPSQQRRFHPASPGPDTGSRRRSVSHRRATSRDSPAGTAATGTAAAAERAKAERQQGQQDPQRQQQAGRIASAVSGLRQRLQDPRSEVAAPACNSAGSPRHGPSSSSRRDHLLTSRTRSPWRPEFVGDDAVADLVADEVAQSGRGAMDRREGANGSRQQHRGQRQKPGRCQNSGGASRSARSRSEAEDRQQRQPGRTGRWSERCAERVLHERQPTPVPAMRSAEAHSTKSVHRQRPWQLAAESDRW